MRPTWTLAGNLRTVLLGLASGGVCPAAVSPRRRCALTAPFHPCLCETHVKPRHRRCVSVALFPGVPPVGVPTTSPCDVRTFLDGLSFPPRLLGFHLQAYRQNRAGPRASPHPPGACEGASGPTSGTGATTPLALPPRRATAARPARTRGRRPARGAARRARGRRARLRRAARCPAR